MIQQIKLVLLLTIFALIFVPEVMAKTTKTDKCLSTREKIEKIHIKMRHKYSNKQGVKYRKKLEKLYKDEFKYCF